MEGPNIFISSCSRRQLARRRPTRHPFRIELLVAVLLAIAAFVVARGGI